MQSSASLRKLCIDFAPLAAFFAGFRLGGVMAATAAMLVATLIAISLSYYYDRKISPMPLMTAVVVGVMGALTLLLHDDTFIKIKPTLINLLFALILFTGLAFKRPTLRYLLGDALALDNAGWRKLSLRWAVFFLFLAGLNEAVWRSVSTEAWVNFKVFGMLTLTMLFTCAQIPLMKRHGVEENSGAE